LIAGAQEIKIVHHVHRLERRLSMPQPYRRLFASFSPSARRECRNSLAAKRIDMIFRPERRSLSAR